MKILGELWDADIAAEFIYELNPKPAKQLEYSLKTGIPLIMFLGEDEIKDGVVKIKELNTEKETFVERKNMIKEVKKFIQKNPVLLRQED